MRIKSPAFIQALNNELSDRRRRISRIKAERTAEVYKAIPQMKALDESISSMAFDLGRQLMDKNSSEDARAIADAVVLEKQAERRNLLKQNGFPEDYLDIEFICPICMDTGRVNRELCQCVTQLAVKTAFDDSGINALECFENFDLSLQHSEKNRSAMSKILASAEKYADFFPDNEKRDLVYAGPPGVGKTYLLNCIGGRVLKRGYSVLKINAYDLIQITMDNLRSNADEKPDFLLPDLLIIDDLGAEPMIPNITVQTLLTIVCRRQDQGKATLAATNLEIVPGGSNSATLMDVYGERLASRLMSPRFVKLQSVRTDNIRFTV